MLGRQGPLSEPALPGNATERDLRERSSEGAGTSGARPESKSTRRKPPSRSERSPKMLKGERGDGGTKETGATGETGDVGDVGDVGVDVGHGEAGPEMPCEPPGECTGCGKEGVIFWDDVDGVFVCHSCEQWMYLPTGSGEEAVVMEGHDDLVNDRPYDPRGANYGTVPVVAEDDGGCVAMNTVATPGARRAIQRGRSYDANVPLKRFVREYGDHLKLTKPVVEEAFEYASRIHRKLPSRSMKLQLMAMSGVYAAIRMNRLPLTLVDLVAMNPKGDLSVYAIGRSYRMCVSALSLQVPMMEPAGLVPKLFDMLLGRCDGELYGPARDAVLRDAKLLIGFISGTETRAQHPTVLAATAIYLAMEMNMLALPRVSDAARAFRIGETALKAKANNIRHAMSAMGQYLVYGENIKPKNAMKYARVIIKLSSLKSRAEASGGSEGEAGARAAVNAAIRRALADEDLGGGDGSEAADHEDADDGDLEDLDVDEYLRL